jgi:TfoX/Sxy family transcriptional regulator of competence genes
MSTSNETIADILERLEPLDVRARSMFGEYGIYCNEKIVALVCDDRFYLKPTAAVERLPFELEPCPPYPGAKEYLILDDRHMQDRAQFQRLVAATADLLPAPKPKRARRSKRPHRKA